MIDSEELLEFREASEELANLIKSFVVPDLARENLAQLIEYRSLIENAILAGPANNAFAPWEKRLIEARRNSEPFSVAPFNDMKQSKLSFPTAHSCGMMLLCNACRQILSLDTGNDEKQFST